jgi:hypothetical protein
MSKPVKHSAETQAALDVLTDAFWRAAVAEVETEIEREAAKPKIQRVKLLRRDEPRIQIQQVHE